MFITSALAGVILFVAAWTGGHSGLGVLALAVALAFAVVVILAARWSETVQGILDRRDERIRGIDLAATASTGLVLIAVIILAAAVELWRGRSGEPFTWLAAVAGVAYLVAVIIERVRR